MRVILSINSGPEVGRELVLWPGQNVKVGRSKTADFSIPDDAWLSGHHFSLSCTEQGCKIWDQGSRNGTTLNGLALGQGELAEGDQIVAGQTTFTVHVESSIVLTPQPAAPDSMAFVPVSEPAAPAPSKLLGRYSVSKCDSGLFAFRGLGDEPKPVVLAAALSKLMPTYYLIDYNRLEGVQPPNGAQPTFIFDWVPQSAAQFCSPTFLVGAQVADPMDFIGGAWGQDALLCIYSSSEPESLLAHLREIVRGKDRKTAKTTKGKVLGFCWPSIAAQLLSQRPNESVSFLLEGIEAVFVEADPPYHWQVFAGQHFRRVFDQLGLDEAATQTVRVSDLMNVKV